MGRELDKIAAVGMFDGVHCGHRAMLSDLSDEARRRGLKPMVVTFLRHPLEVVNPANAPKLLTTASERREMLERCFAGDVVMLDFDDALRRLTARDFMAMLRDKYGVGVMYMGFNHRFGSDRLQDARQYHDIARGLGMDVVVGTESIAECGNVSSSRVRSMLENGDVEQARVALGRCYSIAGRVVPGKRLGRKLGFPTANIEVGEKQKLVPAAGVYACRVTLVDGSNHASMVNIGCRPTVDDGDAVSVEAHIFDFSGDIYGEEVRLEFVKRLRDEPRFDSIESLTTQLHADAVQARKALEQKGM